MSLKLISRTFLFFGTAILPAAAVVLAGLSGCASHDVGGPPPSVQENQIAPSESSPRNAGPNQAAASPGMVPVLIRTAPSLNASQATAFFNKLGVNVVQQYSSQNGILWAVDAPKKARDEAGWIDFLQKQKEVQTAEVDLTRKLAIPTE